MAGSSLPVSCPATAVAVIVFGYLGLALVVGVSAALLVVVARRASDRVRLLLRRLRCGFATGAVTEAVFGASLPLIGSLRGNPGSPVGVMLGVAVYGAVIGAIVAPIPSLIGAVFITDVLRRRRGRIRHGVGHGRFSLLGRRCRSIWPAERAEGSGVRLACRLHAVTHQPLEVSPSSHLSPR